jgi:cytochrome c-type biogenesis protein CcmH/NrfG
MSHARLTKSIPVAIAAGLVAMVMYANWRAARKPEGSPAPQIGAPGGPRTSPEGLNDAIAKLEARLADDPADVSAAVALADVLMRQARVGATRPRRSERRRS